MPAATASSAPPLVIRQEILTPHGSLNLTTSLPTNPSLGPPPLPAILLIHGNSSSSRIFQSFFFDNAKVTSTHRIIAFDLPGHGQSSNAPDPVAAHYNVPGYADAARFVLDYLQVESVIVFGWSLGGHIGIEMIPKLNASGTSKRMKGLMITGTPPVPKGGAALGFKGFTEDPPLVGLESWTEDEITGFAQATCGMQFGGAYEPWVRQTAARTDGRARKEMWSSFERGDGEDQQKTVEEEKDVVLAVVNGDQEPFVNLDFVDGLQYGNLWEGKCHRIEGLGHAPFWEDWGKFKPYLERFVVDCSGNGI